MTYITKVALVTGASSGIGEATALKLHQLGYTVYAGARRVERMADLAKAGIRVLKIDVTDSPQLEAAMEKIISEAGRIDVLVNNAGYGLDGALEDVPLSAARAQFEVNVFALARLTQLALPHMRKQRGGRIINISSVGGKLGLPFGSWYHASKYAVEGLSDCLRLEVKSFGIDVILIEPGLIRTEFQDITSGNLLLMSGKGPYAEGVAAFAKGFEEIKKPGYASPPSIVADTIASAVTSKRPKARYLVGRGARAYSLLRRLLPDRAFDAVIHMRLRQMSKSS